MIQQQAVSSWRRPGGKWCFLNFKETTIIATIGGGRMAGAGGAARRRGSDEGEY